ncbi:hypothetical protein K3888_16130, partial [Dietzia aurantiaca]|nr:hypothetical protein [Dietzia aurantiaca]
AGSIFFGIQPSSSTQKEAAGNLGRFKLTKISDVYGSAWLTAGAGSVLMLEGDPGTTGAEIHHAKQPAEAVGPLVMRHDHATGTTDPVDPRKALMAHLRGMAAEGVTKKSAAEAMFGTATDATRKRAERDLMGLVAQGGVTKVGGTSGGKGGGTETRWVLSTVKFKVTATDGEPNRKPDEPKKKPRTAQKQAAKPSAGASDESAESVGRASDAEEGESGEKR